MTIDNESFVLKMKNLSHRYDTNRRHKYTKYKMCLSIMKVTYI